MSEGMWGIVVTGIVGVLGLGATVLTAHLVQQASAAQAEEQRRESRRSDVRVVLVDLITDAGLFASALIVAFGFGEYFEKNQVDGKTRLKMFAEGMSQIQTSLRSLPRQMTEATLIVEDPVLNKHVADLSKFFGSDGIGLGLAGVQFVANGALGDVSLEVRKAQLKTFVNLVGSMEQRASELLRVSL